MPSQTIKPIALVPVLVRVKTAPSVQHQLDLLRGAGEFCCFRIYPTTQREKLHICSVCGAATTPWGPYGDVLELDFVVHGFRVTFKSRELWAGGRVALRRILKEPEHYCSNLSRLVDRLRIKSLPRPIRPLFPKAGSVAALLSIGLSSFPVIPAAGGVPADKHREHHCEAVAIPERAITAKPAVAIPVPTWIPVKATSYSWREPDHVPFGKHNCMGGDLTHLVEGLEQCAADLSCYPLGSILCIKTDDGEEFRIVTDCGKSVRGAHHIDLHFDSLADMEARGTRKALVIVIRHGWKP